MDCPRCQSPMQEETLDRHLARPVVIDLCFPCQSWFDARESLSLTPGSTLTLFRIIGERTTRPQVSFEDISSTGIVAAGLSTLARWLKS